MSRQEQLRKCVDELNEQNGHFNDWVLLLLTSIADSLATIADNFCQNCGADMRGEENDS